jgi:hypothetical protein
VSSGSVIGRQGEPVLGAQILREGGGHEAGAQVVAEGDRRPQPGEACARREAAQHTADVGGRGRCDDPVARSLFPP